jgi:hypothetical protein
MNKHKKTHRFVITFLVMVSMVSIEETPAAGAYLSSLGPPPLRFQVATTNNALFLSELTLPKPVLEKVADTNPPAATQTTNTGESAKVSSPASLTVADTNQIKDKIVAAMAVTNAEKNPTNNPVVSSAAASDLLTVTPQMINEYLKPPPSEVDTNQSSPFQSGMAILVPAELGFTPPMPQASGESRAIYKSQ